MRWHFLATIPLLAASASCGPHVRRQADGRPLGSEERSSANVDDRRARDELGRGLSPGARLIFPRDPDWTNATSRWSPYRGPHFNVVVEVATAEDVQKTVAFAHKYKVPFLARNRGHGSVGSLEKLDRGIQINIEKLNTIEVFAEQGYAKMGGGVYGWQVIQELYKRGKQSTTGSCSCVGVMGAGLGGGHGRLQGRHGIVADNILSAELVIGNGSLVRASETENPDLLWALKGAGHNFGIVTSFDYKIHDLEEDGDWWTATYIYTSNQFQSVMTKVAEIRPNQPSQLNLAAVFMWGNASSAEPQLLISLNYLGKVNTRQPWAQIFEALNPVSTQYGQAKYKELAETQFNGLNSFICSFGSRRNQYSLGMKEVDVPSALKAWEQFKELGVKAPGARANTLVIYELYPLEYYQSIGPDTTAYPHRDTNIILLFHGVYEDISLDGVVKKYGQKIRDTLQVKSGFSKLQSYLNYAQGDESFGDLYGYQPWRQQKLKTLKKQWDSSGDFSWYEPIPRR